MRNVRSPQHLDAAATEAPVVLALPFRQRAPRSPAPAHSMMAAVPRPTLEAVRAARDSGDVRVRAWTELASRLIACVDDARAQTPMEAAEEAVSLALGGCVVSKTSFPCKDVDGRDVGMRKTLTINANSRIYVLLKVLKKTLYGHIKLYAISNADDRGILRISSSKGNLVVKSNDKKCVFERRTMESCVHVQENPIREMASVLMLGDSIHPNVLPLLGCLEDETNIYSMYPVAKITLMDHMISQASTVRNFKFSKQDVVFLFGSLADGLRYLHNCGLVHRDLSLENIMLTDDGRVWIIDFGLAAPLRLRDAHSGMYENLPFDIDKYSGKRVGVGKSRYMSPEITRPASEAYDAIAADMWAMGVILFTIATGTMIYERADERRCNRFAKLHSRGIAGVIKDWGLTIDEDVVEMLASLLRMVPGDRRVDPLSGPMFDTAPSLD